RSHLQRRMHVVLRREHQAGPPVRGDLDHHVVKVLVADALPRVVGFVHELSWDEIKTLLDNAISIKPKRQMSVQFSGGEPTLSPHFLDAVRYARKVGYNSVQAATNGIAFAQDPEYAKTAAEAGLRYAYLQFDGVGNAPNSHRHVGNLFDVKLQAIENLHSAGVEIVPVTTLINGINNEQVGRIIEFARDNPRKIVFLAFQPVSFTGRDEEITDDRRHAQRYTLADLAHDVKDQTGFSEPTRDWFPLSYISTFSDLADLVHGPDHQWGQYSCGCHPNCGIGMGTMIDKLTGEMVPITAFLKGDQLSDDTKAINNAARSKFWTIVGFSLSVIRNYKPFESPRYFSVFDMLKKFDKQFGGTGLDYGNSGADRTMEDIEKRRDDRWGSLIIAGMWFQDLFNYDFRRTEQCIIPYGTQEGEISFCAYNTGVGWRNIIEKMHMTAKLNEWYDEHGRHEIWAGNREVELPETEHSMLLRDEIVTKEEQHDLDDLGIAKYAHQEKRAKRDEKLAELRAKAENEKMAKLYRQEILGEVAQQAEKATPGKPKKLSQIELELG
ncbi:MAG: radical SAM protein, partial [Acidobacteriota bacterium]|nr:radical SAM protein [Acidobacteriota bacterium]